MLDQVDVDSIENNEMSFLDHLEELRWHLFRSVVAVVVSTVLAFIGKGWVFAIIEGPRKIDFWTYRKMCELSDYLSLGDALCIKELNFTLNNMDMAGQFTQHIVISFAVGLVIAFPYIFWEFWRFFKPALKKSERKFARGIVFFSSLLFMLGILCGYFLLTPISIQFLANYTLSEGIINTITISSYISTITMVTFAAAIVFELPIVVFFLTKAGLVTPKLLREHRKHALIVILIISAIITPPDITSQILLTVPFFVLYEISILVSVSVYKDRLKKMEAE